MASVQTLVVNADTCEAFDSCASCTNSRYPRTNHFYDFDEESEWRRDAQEQFVAWPHRRPHCAWCPLDATCYSSSDTDACWKEDDNATLAISYEYDCPLGPQPYPDHAPSLLPDWIGALLDAAPHSLDQMTVIDLCLPGTHDSLTYDLSQTVSDDGLNDLHRMADILHALSGGSIDLLPGELEEFFRLQAKTQQLTLTQQLDNGIRFLDIRVMMEHDNQKWYSIHFMQSRQLLELYLQEIRDWLDAHPREIVVLWLSRHGDTTATGGRQYPGVTLEQKKEIWQMYLSIFDGLLLDTRMSSIHTTSISTLISRDHRVITFTSDYVEFTGESPFAMDGARIQNYCHGDGVFDEENVMGFHTEYFLNAAANNAAVKAENGFTLMSMNTASPSWQVLDAAKRRFLHFELEEAGFEVEGLFRSCGSKTRIPGISKWCPATLLDIAQLTSYYNHIAIEEAWMRIQSGLDGAYPNAFYLDALDYDGTIRTGIQLLDGAERGDVDSSHKESRYAYVDTVLAYNVRKACEWNVTAEGSESVTSACHNLTMLVEKRRSKYSFERWDDPEYGRHTKWPFQ